MMFKRKKRNYQSHSLGTLGLRRRRSKYKKGSRTRNANGKGRKRLLLVLLLMVLVLVVWSLTRYKAWFHQEPELAYSVAKQMDRITMTSGEDFMHSRTISWRCDTIPQDAWLEYRQDSSMQTLQALPADAERVVSRSGNHAYYYRASMAALEPGNTYSYRLITGRDTTAWTYFSMPQGDETEFLYIGDVQDPEGSYTENLFSNLRQKQLPIDFICWGGDLLEGPDDKYWGIWYRSVGSWPATLPMIAATGNHEYLKTLPRKLDSRWTAQFANPDNGPKAFEGRSFYIDFPSMRVIVLDSNGIGSPSSISRHRSWLRDKLQTAVQPWKVVVMHHPVYAVREGRFNPLMYYGFRSILESEGADLVLQGHDHSYSRIINKDKSENLITPVYVVSTASPKQYRNGFDDKHDRLGSGFPLYQLISVSPEDLHFMAYDFDHRLYDEVKLHKDKAGSKAKIEDNALEWEESFLFNGFADTKKGQKKRAAYIEKQEFRKAARKK